MTILGIIAVIIWIPVIFALWAEDSNAPINLDDDEEL